MESAAEVFLYATAGTYQTVVFFVTPLSKGQ